MDADGQHTHHGNVLKTSACATLHCLLGCAIGETAGLVIGITFGLGLALTIALAVILAYVSGLALAIVPVMRREGCRSRLRCAWCGWPKRSLSASWSSS